MSWSRARSLLALLLAPNAVLWIVTGLALGLLALALYLPGLSGVFRFAPLPPTELAIAVGLGLASVLWFQLLKLGPLTPRLVWGGLAFASAAVVVASLALTPWLDLHPCHLCVFQRLLFMAIVVLALIAAVPASVRGRLPRPSWPWASRPWDWRSPPTRAGSGSRPRTRSHAAQALSA